MGSPGCLRGLTRHPGKGTGPDLGADGPSPSSDPVHTWLVAYLRIRAEDARTAARGLVITPQPANKNCFQCCSTPCHSAFQVGTALMFKTKGSPCRGIALPWPHAWHLPFLLSKGSTQYTYRISLEGYTRNCFYWWSWRGGLGTQRTELGEASCYVHLNIMDFVHVNGQPIQNGSFKFKNK